MNEQNQRAAIPTPPAAPLLTSQFEYELPKHLIPTRPRRGRSRLMVLGSDSTLSHGAFRDLPNILDPGDLLVLNNTRVLRARLRGHRLFERSDSGVDHGGTVEALLIEPLEQNAGQPSLHTKWRAMLRPGKRQRPGQRLVLGGLQAVVAARAGDLFDLAFDASNQQLLAAMEGAGELPLPPYLGRTADARDDTDYQTIYATEPGAVAAPTAGLHFDQEILDRLTEHGIQRASVTLHVGPGTFRPVTSDAVSEHLMDAERYQIPSATAEAILRTQRNGGRIVAVGTTVARALEGSVLRGNGLAGCGRTDLFIVPGHRFRVIDGLLTNFHLPRSTLLMLVSALIGRQRTLNAYTEAVKASYRFYSYGDAMLAWPPAVQRTGATE